MRPEEETLDERPMAVLFDMDGVIVDSEDILAEAAIEMFAEHGVCVEADDFHPFRGMGENAYLGGVAEQHSADLDISAAKARTYELYRRRVAGRLTALPGAEELIEFCRLNGLKTALASSADAEKVLPSLDAIGVSRDRFDTIITGEDVERKKPYPDIYLLAAERIGVDPRRCIVVEDAISGVEAAISAGARCLAVTTSYPREKLKRAHWVVDSLLEAPIDAFV
ncbi:MAG: HAD family hydrolase [Spirochaetaceae bacterium]|nr:MAG: HAD family hydrolase [Spirochaetaceae bacterium]